MPSRLKAGTFVRAISRRPGAGHVWHHSIAILGLLATACAAARGEGHGTATDHRGAATTQQATHRRVASTETPTLTPVANVDYVLLLTVDAFRADQPWVGYDNIETPNLSGLAARSLVYTHTYSMATLTTASLNSMLSSRYPSELNREACIFGKYDLEDSLAPYLQSVSVATLAVHGHAIFADRIAPSLGFEQWRLVTGTAQRRQGQGAVVGSEMADLIVRSLAEERPKHRKAFLWAHFPDPHDSYVTHRAFRSKNKTARAPYDSEVAYTDAAIGRVIQAIDKNGLRDRTAIIVTGDHGEAFGEHGTVRHGFTMFEEEVRVPLLVHIPGIRHRKIEAARSTLDIAPTMVELFGSTPPDTWKGRSLLRDVTDDEPKMRTVIVDLPEMKGRAKTQAVIANGVKVILSGNDATVFDLGEDPAERRPIPKKSERARAAINAARQQLERLDFKRPVSCGGLGRGSAR